ncbi:MAG: DAK2 domain-containing protein [Oscillospiraceae bacterium]|nr:DAK2 domain-containing protein [Oscillospiraceae bacterium]
MMNGIQLRDAFVSGANNISNYRQQVDALNVFPVPDGDTGTNMSMTINAAKRELLNMKDEITVETVSKKAASALLRGARGNSGVILSLLFRGFSKGLEGKETATAADIANALDLGVAAAYKAVMKPTEGTILTVARLAAEKAKELAPNGLSVAEMWNEILVAAKDALAQTPELLPVLKKAGVVDAGGQGFVTIWEGMKVVIDGGEVIASEDEAQKVPEKRAQGIAAEFDEGEITFTYCTEFIINKEDPNADPRGLRAYLESIGDCVVVVDDEEIIKCHVHTNDPGNAIQAALKLGYLTNMKIDNMREQHGHSGNSAAELAAAEMGEEVPEFPYAAVEEENEFGFVAVAAGEGVKQLFIDLGVNNVVSGGQTMNPSTDDILAAIHATPAKHVFVLPNNKNIIMAAEQTINLADREVEVLQTRSIPEGLSAMLAFDPDQDCRSNLMNMIKAFEKVGTGSVTFAARDSDFEGQKIKKGQLLAMEGGKLAFVEEDLKKTIVKLTNSLLKKHLNKEDGNFITLIYGEDVTDEQAEEIQEAVQEKAGEQAEVVLVKGQQPVYYFVISVE